ncbi:hypothetical protein EDD99_3491 [Streptomyces sp. 846.5]|nr:hypothetical protein [Streptomyces sp. 846.5]TDU05006.1 hypothetical protein EDD99_3491 [Streptomyces sp. 846.5]
MELDDDGPPVRHPLPLYGPRTRDETLGPCPPWCGGVHVPREEWGVSQFHATQPIELDIEDATGKTLLYATADFYQYLGSDRPEKALIFIELTWQEGGQELHPEDVVAIADGLTGYAKQLRELAARVVELRGAATPAVSGT